MTNVREAFDAAVDVQGPDPGEWGSFAVQRREGVEHERFLRLVSNHVGGDDYVVLDSPGGLVVVVTSFGSAQALVGHPAVSHVGGVTIDPDRFRQAFVDPTGPLPSRGPGTEP